MPCGVTHATSQGRNIRARERPRAEHRVLLEHGWEGAFVGAGFFLLHLQLSLLRGLEVKLLLQKLSCKEME